MSLVTLLDKALATDLSKTEWRIFATLLRQTLGFGKTSDALSFGRIAQLSGVRKDHAKKAVDSVCDAGLFTRSEHPQYDFLYSSETVQFTARIDSRVMRVVRKEAARSGRSINEQVNYLLQLGLIALVQKRKATGGTVAVNHVTQEL